MLGFCISHLELRVVGADSPHSPMVTPTDEKSSLLRERGEEHARALPAFLSRVFGRHRAAVALALAFALVLGVARVEWDGRTTVGTTSHHHRHHRWHGGRHRCHDCSLDRSRWTMTNDTFPRGRGSCAFVSNDPHLHKLGASIDAHDEVIRLNNFYSRAGDTAHYGHKATFLVANTAFRFLQTSGNAGDFVREFAQVHRCMLRYEPAFRCGRVCKKHNTGTDEYIKRDLDTFGCSYIPEAAYTAAMSALEAAHAADDSKDSKKPFPSTGGLAVFALAPSCAEVHFYGFTAPKPPYHESVHDLKVEHDAFRSSFPHAVWH